MGYVGNKPALNYTSFAVQHFTTSATTGYTLDHAVTNENDIRLVINNVVQQPGGSYAYTAAGTVLTLSAATAGTDTMYCVFLGKAVQTVNPGAGSVGLSQLSATGTASSSTFLRGDNAWQDPGGVSLSGSTNNTVTTVTGANAIQGEAKLTFDGSTLINDQSAGAASEIKASAATVYTKIIADDASGFSAIDYSHDLRFKDAGTEKWRIDSSGNILPSSTSQGVYLGVTSATASNLLDDYEEGTFTPTWASDVTVSVASGNYGQFVKVGNQVTVYFGAVLNATSPAYYQITNAPFQSNIPLGNAVGTGREYGHTGTSQIVYMSDNTTTVSIRKYDASATANAYLHCEITYPTD